MSGVRNPQRPPDLKTITHIALTKPGRRYESQPQRPAPDSRYSEF
jgi:hypothetical protein